MSDDPNVWLAKRHLVSVAAAAVTAFYLHSLSVIMATSSQPTGPDSAFSNQAQWTDAETEAILQYFLNHMSEIGDAGNFRMKTYSAAAGEIPGQTRTSTQVKTKWQSVSKHCHCYQFQVFITHNIS